MPLLIRLACGLVLSLTVALLAYRRRSLSSSGILGAVLTGTLTLGFGGWSWGWTLIAFFLSSSALTHWKHARKAALEQLAAKGGARDLGQALANGGIGTLLAVLTAWIPHPVWPAAFVGALAAATADTWATEVGVLSPTPPRLITTAEAVPAGTSGGVTRWGTGAGALGGLFLGLIFYALAQAEWALLGTPDPIDGWGVLAALAGGLAGNAVDSLLGATLQASYSCPRCGRTTERREHCGGPTQQVRGWSWLTNDGVNLMGTLAGAVVAGTLYGLIHALPLA